MFVSARTGDAPGRIYWVEPSGSVFEVTQVSIQPKKEGQFLYPMSFSTNFTLGEVLKTIGIAAEDFPMGVNAKIDRKTTFQTESSNVEREYLDDRDTDNAIREVLTGIKIRSDNKYYIIRETLRSNSLKFKVNKNWIAEIGVEADIKKLIQSKTNATWQEGSEISIDKTFDKPYRIWYKAEELEIKESLGMGPKRV